MSDPYGPSGSVHPFGGLGRTTTVYPAFDFETYSEVDYTFDSEELKWVGQSKQNSGIFSVGAAVYAEHPSTEILCMAYDLKDGKGVRLWIPDMHPPTDLFDHVRTGGPMEAHNVSFEWNIWKHVATPRYDFPPIHPAQLRCSMARSLHYSLPASLGKVASVVAPHCPKDTDGTRLINLFSKPRQPLKAQREAMRNTGTLTPPRLYPADRYEDGRKLYEYCMQDVRTESEVSIRCPDLSPFETEVFHLQNRINDRGMAVDTRALIGAQKVVAKYTERYNAELEELTNGAVKSGTEIKALSEWFSSQGYHTDKLDADTVDDLLGRVSNPKIHRALELRQLLSNTSLSKIDAMLKRAGKDGRIRDMIQYHKAHTGRFAGQGPQPHNMYNSGPNVAHCGKCGLWYGLNRNYCPWCKASDEDAHTIPWDFDVMDFCLKMLADADADTPAHVFGDPLEIIQASMRGFFVAAPGHELICADYSAIEAVVLAALAGEDWRLRVFEQGTDIYLASMSQTSGKSVEYYQEWKERHGSHHPDRKRGKVKELALGYQGWINAMIQFGAWDYYDEEDEIKQDVMKWRDSNRAITSLWKGCERNWANAVKYPGRWFTYRSLNFICDSDVLHVGLPSGRFLHYHNPRLTPTVKFDRPSTALSFNGWNTDYKRGPVGWMRLDTYGGKLVENIVQAVARDILCNALINLEHGGYPVVLHVHDEPVSEVPVGSGSIEEYERIMKIPAPWYADWPIRTGGGWRGARFRK